MNILLVYPRCPDTYWSFKHALRFISKKASIVPLGLITVASILPGGWKKKLTDLNVSKLKDEDILWADYVFISAMSVQLASVKQVIERCLMLKAKIVGGGPLFTEEYEQFPGVDHLVLNIRRIPFQNSSSLLGLILTQLQLSRQQKTLATLLILILIRHLGSLNRHLVSS